MASVGGSTCLVLLYLAGYEQQLVSCGATHETPHELSCLDCSAEGRDGDASLLQQTLPTANRHGMPVPTASRHSNIQKWVVSSDGPPARKTAPQSVIQKKEKRSRNRASPSNPPARKKAPQSGIQKREKTSRNLVSPSNPWARQLVKFKENVVQRYQLYECQKRVNGSSFEDSDQEIPSHPRDCLWQPDQSQSHLIMDIPVLYVSLGGKTEEQWKSFFASIAKDFQVVHGIKGSDRDAVEAVVSESYDAFLNNTLIAKKPGLLGCALSHLTAIKQAYETGSEMALILESDALPDLVPWWPQSIEDYARGLPSGWEISQLSWTSYYEHLKEKFSDGEHKFFKQGPAWGAISYLIHKDAMKKVMDYVWDEDSKKFDLKKLRAACVGGFTADDCILSMSPIKEDRGPILKAENIYRATPPMFTSFHRQSDVTYVDGVDRYDRKPSYCTDISSILDYSNRFCAPN